MGNKSVCRRASPTTITAATATFIERAFLFMGIRSLASRKAQKGSQQRSGQERTKRNIQYKSPHLEFTTNKV